MNSTYFFLNLSIFYISQKPTLNRYVVNLRCKKKYTFGDCNFLKLTDDTLKMTSGGSKIQHTKS